LSFNAHDNLESEGLKTPRRWGVTKDSRAWSEKTWLAASLLVLAHLSLTLLPPVLEVAARTTQHLFGALTSFAPFEKPKIPAGRS
jgi:hypothetical protein